MAAPTRADVKYYRGANTAPTNDVDPLGGAIYTTSELDQDVSSNLWANVSISPDTNLTYYSTHYRRNTSTGNLANARFYNRAGCLKNSNSGIATITSTASSESISIRVAGKVGGNWDTETLVVTGTTPSLGTKTWDVDTVVRWEAVSGTPVGNLSCSVNSELVGIIYGTNDDPVDGNTDSISCYMISAETTWAVATALNTTVSSANRLTAPSGIGSFSLATYWTGDDASINVPTGNLDADDYIGIVGKLDLLTNVPQPLRNFLVMVVMLGDAQV